MAGRIRTCTEHQRIIAEVVSGVRQNQPNEQLPGAMAGALEVETEGATIVVPPLPMVHGTWPRDQSSPEDWIPLERAEPAYFGTTETVEIEGAVSTEAGFTPTTSPVSPFDELITAVSTSRSGRTELVGPLPPPRRFMVRVARVQKPHRATKRNYDYFEELNESLKKLTGSGSDHGST